MELKHQDFISRCFRSLQTNISDCTFANLFLFRGRCRYRLVRNGEVLIACTTDNGEPCWMPLSDLRRLEKSRLIRLMQDQGHIFPVPEEWVDTFSGSEFALSCGENEMDYLYRMEHMAAFRGGQFNRKRNRLKKFLSLYGPASAPLTDDKADDAVRVLDAWQSESACGEDETDYGPCLEALRLCGRLDLIGRIYYAEGKPAGFLIGETLRERTFAIHFAKGIKTYKGLYEYMFNDAARRLLPHYDYLNLEEDMGKEALRFTKTSYGPDSMVKKFRVRLK